ncbi:MAG: hypothetical protein ABI180_05485 [Microcoleus sp.]
MSVCIDAVSTAQSSYQSRIALEPLFRSNHAAAIAKHHLSSLPTVWARCGQKTDDPVLGLGQRAIARNI